MIWKNGGPPPAHSKYAFWIGRHSYSANRSGTGAYLCLELWGQSGAARGLLALDYFNLVHENPKTALHGHHLLHATGRLAHSAWQAASQSTPYHLSTGHIRAVWENAVQRARRAMSAPGVQGAWPDRAALSKAHLAVAKIWIEVRHHFAKFPGSIPAQWDVLIREWDEAHRPPAPPPAPAAVPAPPRATVDDVKFVAKLNARGILLSAGANGQILSKPAGALTGQEKFQLSQRPGAHP